MDRNLVQKWARIGSKNDPGRGPKVARAPHRFWHDSRFILDGKPEPKLLGNRFENFTNFEISIEFTNKLVGCWSPEIACLLIWNRLSDQKWTETRSKNGVEFDPLLVPGPDPFLIQIPIRFWSLSRSIFGHIPDPFIVRKISGSYHFSKRNF